MLPGSYQCWDTNLWDNSVKMLYSVFELIQSLCLKYEEYNFGFFFSVFHVNYTILTNKSMICNYSVQSHKSSMITNVGLWTVFEDCISRASLLINSIKYKPRNFSTLQRSQDNTNFCINIIFIKLGLSLFMRYMTINSNIEI